MKLLTKTARYYLLFASVTFIVFGFLFYFIVEYIIIRKADESLLTDKNLIMSQLDESDKLDELFLDLTDDYHINEVSSRRSYGNQFSTIEIYDSQENQDEPYRQLKTSFEKEGNFYELLIQKSLVESRELIYSIVIIVIVMFGFLALLITIFNQSIAAKLWKPFYETLDRLKRFNIESGSDPPFNQTGVVEFNELNDVARKLTSKIKQDYSKQKDFIDNVAHEIQTPLAIVNAQIDILIQNENLTESDLQIVQIILETTDRLAKLNDSLLLLSKIENDQFSDACFVDVVPLINRYLGVFEAQLRLEKITTHLNLDKSLDIFINPGLAEILIGNLIQNAIRHNVEGGFIDIAVKDGVLEITNSGVHTAVAPDRFFEKFYKSSMSGTSLGLGLAIVKQICEQQKLVIEYMIQSETHTVRLIQKS